MCATSLRSLTQAYVGAGALTLNIAAASLLPVPSAGLPLFRRAASMPVNMLPRRKASSSFGWMGTNREARSALKLQQQHVQQTYHKHLSTKEWLWMRAAACLKQAHWAQNDPVGLCSCGPSHKLMCA